MMETGRWYPENEAEKFNEAVCTAVLGAVVGVCMFLIAWGVVIGF